MDLKLSFPRPQLTHPYLIGVNVALALPALRGRRRHGHEGGLPAQLPRRRDRPSTASADAAASSHDDIAPTPSAAAAAVREVVGAVVVLLPHQLRLNYADRACRCGVPGMNQSHIQVEKRFDQRASCPYLLSS